MRPCIPVFALMASLACGSDSSVGPGAGASHPVVISAGASSVHQQEATLVQSSSGRIVAAWIGQVQGTVTTIEYAISDNDGATWNQPTTLAIPPAVQAMSDPVLAVDATGNVTLVTLGDGPHMAVYTFRLPVGATTFGGPVLVDQINAGTNWFDKTNIVVTDGGLLVTYSLMGANGVGLAATSTDGISWQHDTLAKNAPVVIAPCAIGRSVTAIYIDNVGGGLWSTSSSDGGRTWSSASQLSATASIASMPQCERRGDDVWVLYGSGPSSLHVLHSSDDAAHFGGLAEITNTAVLFGRFAVLADGTLDVAYYESSSSVPFGFVHSLIPAGTEAFLPHEVIARGLHLTTDRYGVLGYGDYVGMIPGAIAYTDNSSGVSHIAFVKDPRA